MEATMHGMRMMRAVAMAILACATASAAGAQAPGGFRDEFLHQFDASMERALALAEAVPAEKYSRPAATGAMPLGRIFAHIARYNYEYPATAMGIADPAGIGRDTLEQRVTGKAQVIALLRRSGDHVRESVRRMPEAQLAQATTLYGRRVQQWAVLLQLLAHMDDHLGQSIAYARASGVVPPWSQ
jgi:uncharacterized damage-inducible protein DinB